MKGTLSLHLPQHAWNQPRYLIHVILYSRMLTINPAWQVISLMTRHPLSGVSVFSLNHCLLSSVHQVMLWSSFLTTAQWTVVPSNPVSPPPFVPPSSLLFPTSYLHLFYHQFSLNGAKQCFMIIMHLCWLNSTGCNRACINHFMYCAWFVPSSQGYFWIMPWHTMIAFPLLGWIFLPHPNKQARLQWKYCWHHCRLASMHCRFLDTVPHRTLLSKQSYFMVSQNYYFSCFAHVWRHEYFVLCNR